MSYELRKGSYVILFITVNLFFGILIKALTIRFKLPYYTPFLLAFGVFIGAVESKLGIFGDSVEFINNIDPHIIFFVFLPALIFDSSFSMNFHTFKRLSLQIILLAFPGVVLCAFITGLSILYVLPYSDSFNFNNAFLLGSIISATDPVAVVCLLKELGAPKSLSTLLDGESILNDGSSIVLFEVIHGVAVGAHSASASYIIELFCSLSLGGPTIGVAFGLAISFILSKIKNQPVLEVSLTLVAPYLVFFVCEELELHFSGVLGISALGLYMSYIGKTSLSPESIHSLHSLWGFICYAAESLIFVLSGAIIGLRLSNMEIQKEDWGYLIIFYILVMVIRLIMYLLFYPLLKYFAYGFNWKHVIIAVFGGLRGAVALTLSLAIYVDEYYVMNYSRTKDLFLFLTAGTICLTLFINAPLCPVLIRKLRISTPTSSQVQLYDLVLTDLEEQTKLMIEDKLKKSKFFQSANWSNIDQLIYNERYLNVKKKYTGVRITSNEYSSEIDLLNEIRGRYYLILNELYWNYFQFGFTEGETCLVLMETIENCKDNQNSEMNDWKYLEKYIKFNIFENLILKVSKLKKFSKKIIFRKIYKNYDATIGFIKGHLKAKDMIKDFHFPKEVYLSLNKEIEINLQKAKNYLYNNIYPDYGDLICNIQTHKAMILTVNFQKNKITESFEKGYLNDNEYGSLRDNIEETASKIKYHLPNEVFISFAEIMRNSPFFTYSFSQEDIEKIILKTSEEVIKVNHQIFDEQNEIKYIYLVIKGSVLEQNKFYSKTYDNTDLLNLRYIKNNRISNTSCTALTVSLIAKIPISIIEELITIKGFENMWREEIIDFINFKQKDFPIVATNSSTSIEKFFNLCQFQYIHANEMISFEYGIILISGEAKQYQKLNEKEKEKIENIILLEDIPFQKFFLKKECNIVFTKPSFIFIISKNASMKYESFKTDFEKDSAEKESPFSLINRVKIKNNKNPALNLRQLSFTSSAERNSIF